MNLITNNTVTVNIGIGGEQITTIVKGVLNVETIIVSGGMDLKIQYAYLDANNADAILRSSSKIVTEAEQTALYNQVNPVLPDPSVDFGAWYRELLYHAFRVEMADTFSLQPSDISIVP